MAVPRFLALAMPSQYIESKVAFDHEYLFKQYSRIAEEWYAEVTCLGMCEVIQVVPTRRRAFDPGYGGKIVLVEGYVPRMTSWAAVPASWSHRIFNRFAIVFVGSTSGRGESSVSSDDKEVIDSDDADGLIPRSGRVSWWPYT